MTLEELQQELEHEFAIRLVIEFEPSAYEEDEIALRAQTTPYPEAARELFKAVMEQRGIKLEVDDED